MPITNLNHGSDGVDQLRSNQRKFDNSSTSEIGKWMGAFAAAALVTTATPSKAEAGSGPAPEFIAGNFAPTAVVRNTGKSYLYGVTKNSDAGGVFDVSVAVFDTPMASPSVYKVSGLNTIVDTAYVAVSPSGRKICVYNTDTAYTHCGDLDGSGKNVSNLKVLPNPSSVSVPKPSILTGGGFAFIGEDHLAANDPFTGQLILIPIVDEWSTMSSSILSLSSCSTSSGVNLAAGNPIGGNFYLNSNAAGSYDLYVLTYNFATKSCVGSPQNINNDPVYGVVNTAQHELGGAVDSNGDVYFARYNASTSVNDLYVARKAGTVLPDAGVDGAVPDAGTDSGVDAAPNLDGGVDAAPSLVNKIEVFGEKCKLIDLNEAGVGGIQADVQATCRGLFTKAGWRVPTEMVLGNMAQVAVTHTVNFAELAERAINLVPRGVKETIKSQGNPNYWRFGTGAGGILGNEGTDFEIDTTDTKAYKVRVTDGKVCFGVNGDYNNRWTAIDLGAGPGCVPAGYEITFTPDIDGQELKLLGVEKFASSNDGGVLPDGGVLTPDAGVANVPNNPEDKGGCSSAPEGYTDFSGSGFLGLAAAMIAARLGRKRRVGR